MLSARTNDAEALALVALAALLADDRRAVRFLDLTGLDSGELRERALGGDRGLLAATLEFLENHEPDLIAVARAIDVAPATLVAARGALEA